MKWTRAVHHVGELAEKCAELEGRPRTMFPLRVVGLWAFGDILGPVRDLDWVHVALVVDLPAAEVPWLSVPGGAEHWANATRMSKNPFVPRWRSSHAPVWNHRIDRPAPVWDAETGVAEETLAALAEGRGADVRVAGPTQDELRERLDDELTVCLSALRDRTQEFEDLRWKPGKLNPIADALWRASDGYLDILDSRAKATTS